MNIAEKMAEHVNSHSSLYAEVLSPVCIRIRGASFTGFVDHYPSTGSVVSHSSVSFSEKKISLQSLMDKLL